MSIRTALRLVGFLAPRASSDRDIAAAKQLCITELGIVESVAADDRALQARLWPILKERGFAEPAKTFPDAANGTALVAGRVRRDEGSARLDVEVCRVDLRGRIQEVLARTSTTEQGELAVSVAAAPSTLVSIRIEAGGALFFASPPRVLEDDLWIERSSSGDAVPGPGRFDVREALLRSALRAYDVRLEAVDEAGDGAMIETLGSLTGLRAETVRQHVLAAKLARDGELGVPAALLSALMGPPARAGEVRVSFEELDTLDPASPRLARGGDDLEKARARVIARVASGGLAPVDMAIGVGELSPRASLDVSTAEKKLQKAVQASPRARAIDGARTLSQLFEANGVPIVPPDVPLDERDPRRASPLRGLTERAVARLSAADLDRRLGALDAPRRAAVIDAALRQADADYPGDSLVRRRAAKLAPSTREFLDAKGDSFDLLESFVDGQLAREPSRPGVDESARRTELLTLQRVARVSRNAGIAEALLDEGYDSAQSIAFTDASQFATDLAGAGVSKSDAERVYRRAQAHYRSTVEAYLRLNRGARGPDFPSLGGRPVRDPSQPNIPTYAYLFGSQDYAIPESWESVTSAGAYLVDLLVWLSKAPRAAGTVHPYDAVVARRPDLVSVLLNQANTETLVPHIDLVCEMLEDSVAARRGLARTSVSELQTTRSAEEIRAYPEHVNTAVYDALRTSALSMALPFDLALEEVRANLQSFDAGAGNATRLALVRLFGSALFASAAGAPTSGAKDAAAETLGLGKREFEIIAAPRPEAAVQKGIWGAATIRDVASFLHHAIAPTRPREHLTYEEGIALLQTSFVHAQARVQLASGVTIDRGKVDERVFEPALQPDELDRANRLLRLARRMRCSIAELDALIAALGGGPLDDGCLVRLAAAVAVMDRWTLSADEAAALFRDFARRDVDPRADGSLSLYARTFLVHSDAEALPAAYTNDVAPPLALASEQGRICAALAIPPADFAALLAATGLGAGNVTFASLSTLYRHARLAQATSGASGRSLADFEALVSLLGSPFANVEALTRFLDHVARIDAAALTVDDVRCLSGAAAPALLATSDLDAALDALRDATCAQLVKSGAPSDPASVDLAIVNGGSWLVPVAAWLPLDVRVAAPLRHLDGATVSALIDRGSPTRTAALARVGRLARLVLALGITAAEAESLVALPGYGAWLASPDWSTLAPLLDTVKLARDACSLQVFAAYAAAAKAASSRAGCARALASALGLDEACAAAAWIALDPADPPTAAHDVAFLDRVRRAVLASDALGVAPSTLKGWALTWPTAAQAAEVRDAVRAKLPRSAWLAQSTAVQNRLRGLKRDALVAELLCAPPASPADPKVPEPVTIADFTARYLIDVEMEACRDTSRIVQASAAVQLMVERCVLGLESGILASTDDTQTAYWAQWEWRKRYRLWEANRKIFLYPEDYLTVSNRTDASPLFREFEKKTVQTEITEDSVSAALEEYLTGLEKIARLEYQSVDVTTGPGTTLGVVARSAGAPPTYYYRRFRAGRWLPWEEVSLGPSPGALALAQGDSRAWIVWPTVSDAVHPDQKLPAAQASGTPATVDENGGKRLMYVRYAWSMRDDRGAWSEVKTTSRAVLMTGRDPRRIALNARPDFPSPRAILLQLLSPDLGLAPGTADDSVFWTSAMHVVRDATYSAVQPAISFPGNTDPTKWKDHYAEYRLSAPLAASAQLDPWDGFHFDANRMVAGTSGAIDLKVPVYDPAANPSISTVTLCTVPAPVWSTKSRGFAPNVAGNQAPAPDAFFLGGGAVTEGNGTRAVNWSVMLVSPKVAPALLPNGPTVPASKFLMVPAYHPFASELVTAVQDGGLRAIYRASLQEHPEQYATAFGRAPLDFGRALGLKDALVVLGGGQVTSPLDAAHPALEGFDFDALSPYALYNYETFFFAPVSVALRLSASRRFQDAQGFYHFTFNPMSAEKGTTPARFWVTKPFRQLANGEDVESILEAAAGKAKNPWQVIEDAPFDPHAVAASRPTAYQKYVVKSYLDNLIAWGDSLYRKATREDVDEATTLYQLAGTILGERPSSVPLLGARTDRAFVKPEDWLGGSNVLVELESLIRDAGERFGDAPPVFLPLIPGHFKGNNTVHSLYFRVPPNEQMLSYWDTVEQRLRNIRACRTIDGGVASLALFAAPINPQALADAAALGLSVADAIAMASASPPPYRFRLLLSKAQEHCGDVKALGAALLTALEKRDGEHLAVVRSQFEEPILKSNRAVKMAQRSQTEKEVEALEKGREMVEARRAFFASREYMNDLETTSFALSGTAGVLEAVAAALDMTSGGLELIPEISVGVSGFGGTPQATMLTGGSKFANSSSKWAQGMSKVAGLLDRGAALVTTQAGYKRRKEDWDQQAAQASLELAQCDVQIAAAKLRLAVIDAELQGLDANDKSWRQTDRLLREKFTNEDLYDWYAQRLTEVYRAAYEQAFQLSALAKQCFVFETGESGVAGPPADAWDRLKNGLLAGESLSRYLRDLEVAYLAHPLYDRVITSHVPLRLVAPAALASLVTSGATGDFVLPGWWLKRLYPGVHRRRVRSIAVSVPCVTGAYVSVNATLEYRGSDPTVVKAISLSTGNGDTGWDASTRAERYMPFEGIGLDGDTTWSLSFPAHTDIDVSTIADVVMHIEYGADVGSDSADTPQTWKVFIDVPSMAPDAWSALVASDGAHTCSLDPSELMPSFLNDYQVKEAGKFQALVDADGHVLPGMLDCTVHSVAGKPVVDIAPVATAHVPWSTLRHLVLVLAAEKTP